MGSQQESKICERLPNDFITHENGPRRACLLVVGSTYGVSSPASDVFICRLLLYLTNLGTVTVADTLRLYRFISYISMSLIPQYDNDLIEGFIISLSLTQRRQNAMSKRHNSHTK